MGSPRRPPRLSTSNSFTYLFNTSGIPHAAASVLAMPGDVLAMVVGWTSDGSVEVHCTVAGERVSDDIALLCRVESWPSEGGAGRSSSIVELMRCSAPWSTSLRVERFGLRYTDTEHDCWRWRIAGQLVCARRYSRPLGVIVTTPAMPLSTYPAAINASTILRSSKRREMPFAQRRNASSCSLVKHVVNGASD